MNQVRVFAFSGAPTSGSAGTGAGHVQVGDLLVNTVGLAFYLYTATVASSGTGAANSPRVPASITWTLLVSS